MVDYENFIVDIAVAFGANASEARRDAEDMVDFEMQLANVWPLSNLQLYKFSFTKITATSYEPHRAKKGPYGLFHQHFYFPFLKFKLL